MDKQDMIDHWKDYIEELQTTKAGMPKETKDRIDAKIKGVEFCIKSLRRMG